MAVIVRFHEPCRKLQLLTATKYSRGGIPGAQTLAKGVTSEERLTYLQQHMGEVMFKCASIFVASFLLLTNPIPNSIYNMDIPSIVVKGSKLKKIPEKELQLVREKKERDREVMCLAKNMYFEARGESREGQIAVASVTLNRAKKKYSSNTICGVVNFRVKNRCAFSWTCDGKEDVITDKKTFTELQQIAYNMYGKFKSGKQYDQTSGALYFHASYVEPEWMEAKVRITKIGEHIFYR